jgi:hypothetical protein
MPLRRRAWRRTVGLMSAPEPLVLDLLDWLGAGGRPYADVMDAWRTSCPRLPVWEDANERGLVACHRAEGGGSIVVVTPVGRALLANRRTGA